MRFIIENEELTDILWEEGRDGDVLAIPQGVRQVASLCPGSWEDDVTPPDIKEVILPGSVERIDAEAFLDKKQYSPFPNLHTIRFQGTLKAWCAMEKGWHDNFDAYIDLGITDYDLYLQDEDGKEYLVEDLVIPKDISVIGAGAFIGCRSLRTVRIPGNVRIMAAAFVRCPNLCRVTIEGSYLELWYGVLFDIDDDEQFPFDQTEKLEIFLSEEAAEGFIFDESFDVRHTPIRLRLREYEETLGEILDIKEDFGEKYHNWYGTDIDDGLLRFFREYRAVARREEGRADRHIEEADEETEGEEADPDNDLPEGYHYDEEMAYKRRLLKRIQALQRSMCAYRRAVRDYAADLAKALEDEAHPVPECDLPESWPLLYEALEIRDSLEDRMYALVENEAVKEAISLPEEAYVCIGEVCETLQYLGDTQDILMYGEDWRSFPYEHGQAISREEYLEENKNEVDELLVLLRDAEEQIEEMLDAL